MKSLVVSLRASWKLFMERATRSPNVTVLYWFTGGAFFCALVLSIDFFNPPLTLEEMQVYEGVLVDVYDHRGKFSRGVRIRLRIDGKDGEVTFWKVILRSEQLRYLSTIALGEQVRLWVQDPYYTFPHIWLRRVHQIQHGEVMVDEYDDARYQRYKNTYEMWNYLWVGIPFFLGMLGVIGIWRIDNREKKVFAGANKNDGLAKSPKTQRSSTQYQRDTQQ